MTTANEFLPDESEVVGYTRSASVWVEVAKLALLAVFLLEVIAIAAVIK